MSSSELPPPLLRGVELFNATDFFAAHEAWEEIWLPAQGAEKQFLHALIQTAAALHHLQRGNLKGAASIWRRAQAKFIELPTDGWLLHPSAFVAECERYFALALADANHQLPFPQLHLNYGSKT